MIVNLVQIHDQAKKKIEDIAPLGFKLSDSMKKALKTYKIITDGPSFDSFMSKMKFQVLLSSSDASKIYHLARNYTTDEQMYEGKYLKTVTATDRDLVIKIDKHTSKDLLQIKQGGQMLLADTNSFKSGSKLSVTIPKGESAVINFPAKPQIINFSGRMSCRNQSYEITKNNEWHMMQDTAQCAAVQVYSSHEAALFVGGDDSLWGMGYRA